MKKFTAILLASCVMVTAAQANSFKGFYTGVSLGYGKTKSDIKAVGGTSDGTKANLSGSNAIFDVFGGYGAMFGCFYAGGELSLGHNGVSLDLDKAFLGKTGKMGKRSGLSYGLALRLGYVITPTGLIYVRLGGEGAKYELDDRFKSEFKTTSKRVFAFAPGLGFEALLTKNISIRGEYVYTASKKLSFDANTNPQVRAVEINPRQHAFKVGVSYHF